MRTQLWGLILSIGAAMAAQASLAHDLPSDPLHHLTEAIVNSPSGRLRVIDKTPDTPPPAPTSILRALTGELRAAKDPQLAAAFAPFADTVKTRFDDRWLYVESNGMPAHDMMVGITNWQQQVPLPKDYTGRNAWQIPLHPVPAKEPASIKGRFLRGAIALAVNGVPIFNPQNNRGEVSALIGELDQWGGHCGRGDDYHYHAAPLHLEEKVGKGKPIAIALDGYPIYGTTGPDGKPVDEKSLDAFRGKTHADGSYAYYASTTYPYVQGGFHGEVTEAGGQVDPQPQGRGIREAMPPLRGAKITGFTRSDDQKRFSVKFEVNGEKREVNYQILANGAVKFDFVDGSGNVRTETYSGRGGGGGGDRPPRPDDRRPQPRAESARPESARAEAAPQAKAGGMTLKSPVVADGGALPKEFTGDGESATPPLEWSGAPAGTASYAVVMHHIDPEGKTKWYWVLYDIPADVTSLPKNVTGVGTLGNNSINGRVGYAPPHSKGPGVKKYVLTVYALSGRPKVDVRPAEVSREVLLKAMERQVLASAEMTVTYERR